jgi:hypothetical protein
MNIKAPENYIKIQSRHLNGGQKPRFQSAGKNSFALYFISILKLRKLVFKNVNIFVAEFY